MKNIYVISDTHYDRRTDPEKDAIRKAVAGCDGILIHLGDVGEGFGEVLLRQLSLVPILVLGNHDKGTKSHYYDMGFSLVVDMIVVSGVVLTHKPVSWETCVACGVSWNIHGHFHDFGSDRWEPDLKSNIGKHSLLKDNGCSVTSILRLNKYIRTASLL